jgi:hypothetical protein
MSIKFIVLFQSISIKISSINSSEFIIKRNLKKLVWIIIDNRIN